MPQPQNQDPYAPPHHDRSGAVVRLAIVAALIGAAAWGYAAFQSQPQTAPVPEIAQEQQMAANDPSPTTLPEATSDSLPDASPAPAPAPTPAPVRRAAPERTPAPAPTPVPTEPEPPQEVTPAPIPPLDLPPAA